MTSNRAYSSAMDKPNNLHKRFFNTGNNFTSKSNNQGFNINDCGDNYQNPNAQSISNVFFGDKSKTANFFKGTKVGSCSHIVEHKGRTFAVPYEIRNTKGKTLSSYKFYNFKKGQDVSVYRKDYTPKVIMHAGMGKKPLTNYDPLSYRNRLPISDFYMPHKNASNLDIGVKADINRKQWVSTTKDSYQWPQPTPVTNTGILAETFRNHHKKLVSYN